MPSTRFKLKAPQPKESSHQQFLFDWIDQVGQHRWPELKWAYAVPNGASYYGQHRFAEAAKQRAMGLRRGVPDVVLPIAARRVHPMRFPPVIIFHPTVMLIYLGLYIEMKRSKSDPLKPEQEAYRDYLISAGYAYARCDSGQQAVAVVEQYMEGQYQG